MLLRKDFCDISGLFNAMQRKANFYLESSYQIENRILLGVKGYLREGKWRKLVNIRWVKFRKDQRDYCFRSEMGILFKAGYFAIVSFQTWGQLLTLVALKIGLTNAPTPQVAIE